MNETQTNINILHKAVLGYAVLKPDYFSAFRLFSQSQMPQRDRTLLGVQIRLMV